MITTPEDKDKKIVRDGEVVRVPLTLMDGVQRSVVAARLHDGMGREAGHRPGFVFANGQNDEVSRAARATYVKLLGDAWRGATPAGSSRADDAYADYVADLGDAWRSP